MNLKRSPRSRKIYFASDVHLRAPYIKDMRLHEQIFVNWLHRISADADKIFLLGDIFDFWFEYPSYIPRGSTRLLAEICRITDNGGEVHIFTGNHDFWMFDYLQTECGAIVHNGDYEFEVDGKIFHVGHGDQIGKYDRWYAFMKWCFNNKVVQFIFALFHPEIGALGARIWSGGSRKSNNKHTELHSFRGPEREYQMLTAKEILASGHKVDYFLFGHRHIIHEENMNGTMFFFIGDWVRNFSYALYDGEKVQILYENLDEKTKQQIY